MGQNQKYQLCCDVFEIQRGLETQPNMGWRFFEFSPSQVTEKNHAFKSAVLTTQN